VKRERVVISWCFWCVLWWEEGEKEVAKGRERGGAASCGERGGKKKRKEKKGTSGFNFI
jgi:hypothetical protein